MEHETEVEMMNKKITDLRTERDKLIAERDIARADVSLLQADLKTLNEAFDKAAAETIAMEECLTGQLAASEERVAELEAECMAHWKHQQLTALTSAPAAVRMEYDWDCYSFTPADKERMNQKAKIWDVKTITADPLCDGYVIVVWQRPVASANASDVSEVGE